MDFYIGWYIVGDYKLEFYSVPIYKLVQSFLAYFSLLFEEGIMVWTNLQPNILYAKGIEVEILFVFRKKIEAQSPIKKGVHKFVYAFFNLPKL